MNWWLLILDPDQAQYKVGHIKCTSVYVGMFGENIYNYRFPPLWLPSYIHTYVRMYVFYVLRPSIIFHTQVYRVSCQSTRLSRNSLSFLTSYFLIIPVIAALPPPSSNFRPHQSLSHGMSGMSGICPLRKSRRYLLPVQLWYIPTRPQQFSPTIVRRF